MNKLVNTEDMSLKYEVGGTVMVNHGVRRYRAKVHTHFIYFIYLFLFLFDFYISKNNYY